MSRREVARAFQLDSKQLSRLKNALKQLEDDGAIDQSRRRFGGRPGGLPRVGVVEVTGPDADGDLLARPVDWKSAAPPPTIYVAPGQARPLCARTRR